MDEGLGDLLAPFLPKHPLPTNLHGFRFWMVHPTCPIVLALVALPIHTWPEGPDSLTIPRLGLEENIPSSSSVPHSSSGGSDPSTPLLQRVMELEI